MTRVAYVVGTFPKLSETFIAGELSAVQQRGIDVRILALKKPDDPLQHDNLIDHDVLERTTYDLGDFDRVLDQFQPELVHAHFATEPADVARRIARQRHVPYTFTAHGYDVYRRPPADLAERAVEAASVITVSNANRRHLTEQLQVPVDRVTVIACGIDTDYFTPGVPDDHPPLIVCVARLREVKQLDLLIRACAVLRDRGVPFHCVIVGEGPERSRLTALRSQLLLGDRVALVGAATQEEVRRWWRRAAVATLSSRSEGMPVSLMEAAACGVPAVAPAVGGIGELLQHGRSGLVVGAGNLDAYADALHAVLASQELRAAMGQEARQIAIKRFSRTTQIDRLIDVWAGAIARRVH